MLFLLCFTVLSSNAFALNIDANTKIKWNPRIVYNIIENSGCSNSYSFMDHILSGPCSLSDIASACMEYCYTEYYDKYSEPRPENPKASRFTYNETANKACKELVDDLITENNKVAEITDFVSNVRDQNTCEANKNAIWAKQAGECIPKNPCVSDKYDGYCDRDFAGVNYFDIASERLSPNDVMNIFLEQKGFTCRISDKDVLFQDEKSVYVLCNDNNNTKIFEFSTGIHYLPSGSFVSPSASITELLGYAFGGGCLDKTYDEVEKKLPAICRLTEADCHSLYNLVGNKISVIYIPTRDPAGFCLIGDTEPASQVFMQFGKSYYL